MHKVWLYAPGENASKWDVCLSQNIMCIGWDEMGNLLEYASKYGAQNETYIED